MCGAFFRSQKTILENQRIGLRDFKKATAVFQKRIHTFAEPSQLLTCRLQANYKNEPNQDEQEQWKVERNWQRRRNAADRTTAHSPYSAPTAT